MDTQLQKAFTTRWKEYFGRSQLPICYYYTDQARQEDVQETKQEGRCLICNLSRVLAGHPFVYDGDSPGCSGGKRYTGFLQELRPNFDYFLSCGIPGKMEGERYKKSPELVREFLTQHPAFEAPGQYLVFKRWDKLQEDEQPLVVVFFAPPDLLAGLFTLANYDRADPQAVITPMGSGCASIVEYPYQEVRSEQPHAVLGMFDVSARPCVAEGALTFALPMKRMEELVVQMDESFLTTESWKLVKKRLNRS
jgi:uncharacterized protein (DUF169 family)